MMLRQEELTSANRSLEIILERRARRIRQRVQVFAPDFIHGDATLDELYARFGSWADEVAFVRSVVQGGRLVAVSVARFDDWFLSVEHASSSEVELQAWLDDRLDGRRSVIELATYGGAIGADDEHWITMTCDVVRLHELERSVLSVTRDAIEENEDWTQTAQTDLLSLVCLCARLGKDA